MLRLTAFCLICWVILAAPAFAQLQGRFYLDKNEFIAGEPVYLHFEVTNVGKETTQIQTAYRYSFCAGYQIKISDGSPPPVRPSDGCALGGKGGSCASSDAPLASGERKTEDLLLNDERDLSKPGMYYITATRVLPYGTASQVLTSNGPKFLLTEHFRIAIRRGDEITLKAILHPYIDDLAAKDQERNSEAQIVIGSVAPLFLEGKILEMLNSDSHRGFAMGALRKMNTARSRKALAEVATKNGEWQEQAIRYLGEMGDRNYYPLVLRAAKTFEPGSNTRQTAIRAAAELGKDESVPFLASLLQSHVKWNRINAVQGMYESASRESVPYLIGLLLDKDDFIAQMAAGTLVGLTHRTPVSGGPIERSKNPVAQHPAWSRWWSLLGSTAPIYRPEDCGEVEPLEEAP